MFKKICIIGCGLIGSSLARAIKEKNLSKFEESYFDLIFHPSLAKDQQKSKVNCWHKALGTAGLIKNGQ